MGLEGGVDTKCKLVVVKRERGQKHTWSKANRLLPAQKFRLSEIDTEFLFQHATHHADRFLLSDSNDFSRWLYSSGQRDSCLDLRFTLFHLLVFLRKAHSNPLSPAA